MAEYIEREALLEDIQAAVENGGMGSMVAGALKRYVTRVPAADVAQVRHGRWEWDTEDIYRCSNCAEKSHVKEVMGHPEWDFCPNCGAKMDGGNGNDGDDFCSYGRK